MNYVPLLNSVYWRVTLQILRRSVTGALLPLCIFGVLNGALVSVAAAPTVEIGGAKIVGNAQPTLPKETFRAVITQYSRADSCHNRRHDGKCLMASGKPVYVGAVACPSFLALGTTVTVNDRQYTCEDRYAQWLDRHRGLPTIDIFVESNPRGRSVVVVEVS